MEQVEITDFVAKLHSHVGLNDYVIVSLGARGPNADMPDGNLIATVRIGNDEATAEAKYLADAVTLARGIILRQREAKAKEAKKEKSA